MRQPFHPSQTFRYDFERLSQHHDGLAKHLIKKSNEEWTIDFSNPTAVFALNQSILQVHFKISHWTLPAAKLCPPIPSRAQYIYHMAELLTNDKAHIMDIGCGANLIYPLLGTALYSWTFEGSDVSESSLAHAQELIDKNQLQDRIKLKHQKQPEHILQSVLDSEKYYDAIICNPPFYSNKMAAEQSNQQKNQQLFQEQKRRNFGGVDHELCFPGGEFQFINNMLYESQSYGKQVGWFSSLVSQSSSLKNLLKLLKKYPIAEHRVLDLHLGNKKSRILAWKY